MTAPPEPVIFAAPSQVKLSAVSANAVKVIETIRRSGFQAYLVGGCVRDLLLGLKPKDFDVATDARPEQVKKLFTNCRLIGRRFRLAHVLFGREIIEVATFRGHHQCDSQSGRQQAIDYRKHTAHTRDGRIVRDNVYGTIEEDAVRRDFTINALYWDIQNHQILDYTQAMADIKAQKIRLIGDTPTRYREDPVRMLRAVRFGCKLNFQLASDTRQYIGQLSHLLDEIPPARLFDESIKLFQGGYGQKCFEQIQKFPLLQYLFPSVVEQLKGRQQQQVRDFIVQALINTDQRIATGKPVNPAFFLAVLLWYPLQQLKATFLEYCQSEIEAMHKAAAEVIYQQQGYTNIPKRFSMTMKDIWLMQWHLQHPSRKQALRLLQHKRFRAAYDFLQLRVETGAKEFQQQWLWWTDIQEQTPEIQMEMIGQLKPVSRRRRKKKNITKKHKPV